MQSCRRQQVWYWTTGTEGAGRHDRGMPGTRYNPTLPSPTNNLPYPPPLGLPHLEADARADDEGALAHPLLEHEAAWRARGRGVWVKLEVGERARRVGEVGGG